MPTRYATTLAIVSFALAGAARAETLRDEIDEIHRIDAEIQRGPERAGQLLGRSARLKQAAIEHAIVAYAIDTRSLVAGVNFTPHGGMRDREGATLLDRDGTLRVQIGPPAFRSAGWLHGMTTRSIRTTRK